MGGYRLPLSHYGTGVHELVIICSSLVLNEDRIVCIEEPEIHLHPELLRKFLQFLNRTKNTYFIATHSNVLLDADENVTVYHLSCDDSGSKVTRTCTNNDSRAVLRDLGYRASDLLQANGVIWVEGPSDRIYVNRWLELFASEDNSQYVEGIHYSIMFYGGACLANVTAADRGPTPEFVELLRINGNAIVVIDRDGTSINAKLREYKQRIQQEIGEDRCWITLGREIENYLSPDLIGRFLDRKRPGEATRVRFDRYDRLQDRLNRAVKAPKLNYDNSKRQYAREICEAMTREDLDCLDLRKWIRRIHAAIAGWNGRSSDGPRSR